MAIVSHNDNNIISDTSDFQSTSFTIKTDSAMFAVFRKSIYTDIQLAPIRELSTNAVDACVESSLPIVWDVHLPTHEESYFSVRDYGGGISKSFLEGDFTVVGASTKRNSNTTNGQFGFGRLSPLAYTSSFTVESWNSGMYYSYLVSIVEGIPTTLKLQEQPSSEPSGAKFSFAIEPNDIPSFRDKALELYKYFDHPPTSINAELRTHMVIYDSDTYMLTNDNSGIVMANVYYPFTGNHVRPSYRGLILKVPTGKVALTPGRESLNYDAGTISYLSTFINDVEEEIIASANLDIISQPTPFSQGRLYNTLKERTPYEHRKKLNPPPVTATFNATERIPILSNTFSVVCKSSWYKTLRTPSDAGVSLTWFYDTPVYVADVSNFQAVIRHSGISSGVIIKPSQLSKSAIDQSVAATLQELTAFGITSYTLLSSLNVDIPESIKRKAIGLKMRRVRSYGIYDYDDSMGTIYYVPYEGTNPIDGISEYAIDKIATHYGISDVYGISKTNLKKVQDNDNFINLFDYINEQLETSSPLLYHVVDYSNALSFYWESNVEFLASDDNPFVSLRLAAQEQRRMDTIRQLELVPDYVAQLRKHINITSTKFQPKYSVTSEFKRFPLIDAVRHNRHLPHYLKLEYFYEQHKAHSSE